MLLSPWCKKSCTHLTKGVLSSGVQVLVLGVSTSGKGKSQAGCLGTGRRSQERTRIKSLLFAFEISEIYSVYLLSCK